MTISSKIYKQRLFSSYMKTNSIELPANAIGALKILRSVINHPYFDEYHVPSQNRIKAPFLSIQEIGGLGAPKYEEFHTVSEIRPVMNSILKSLENWGKRYTLSSLDFWWAMRAPDQIKQKIFTKEQAEELQMEARVFLFPAIFEWQGKTLSTLTMSYTDLNSKEELGDLHSNYRTLRRNYTHWQKEVRKAFEDATRI